MNLLPWFHSAQPVVVTLGTTVVVLFLRYPFVCIHRRPARGSRIALIFLFYEIPTTGHKIEYFNKDTAENTRRHSSRALKRTPPQLKSTPANKTLKKLTNG
jgi:hypothetical protein